MSRLKEAFEIKLRNELEEISSDLFSRSQLEDISMVLINSSWSDKVLLSLIARPIVIRDLAHAMHLDEAFSAFFEIRLRALTLALAETG